MDDRPVNVAFIDDLARLVKQHYPDGKMHASDIVTYFGIVLAGAVAGQSEEVRDRCARQIAQAIRFPNAAIRRLGR